MIEGCSYSKKHHIYCPLGPLGSPGISGERGEDVIRTFLKDIICYLSSVLCSGHAQPKNYIDVIIYFYVEKALTNAKLYTLHTLSFGSGIMK